MPKFRLMRKLLKTVIVLFFVIWLPIAKSEVQSLPMRLTIQNCEHRAAYRERFTCAIMMHDTMCFSSVIKGALDINDDRKHCMTEADTPIFKKYLNDALEENKNNSTMQAQMQDAYKQWQHNISTLAPQPLEPEYQFKLRRDTNSQALLFKLLAVQAGID